MNDIKLDEQIQVRWHGEQVNGLYMGSKDKDRSKAKRAGGEKKNKKLIKLRKLKKKLKKSNSKKNPIKLINILKKTNWFDSVLVL